MVSTIIFHQFKLFRRKEINYKKTMEKLQLKQPNFIRHWSEKIVSNSINIKFAHNAIMLFLNFVENCFSNLLHHKIKQWLNFSE